VPPGRASVAELARAAQGCRGCDLHERATQAVFGSGPVPAGLMLVGEQPGDVEDREGKPFVGPAGRILTRALKDVGLSAEDAYVTNAVKHFRWHQGGTGGKRRIHERPDPWQVRACVPWLEAEIERVNPRLLVTLGAVAGQALFGSSFRVGQHRGEQLSWRPDAGGGLVIVPTIHPSAVLRADDREAMYGGLVADLQVAVDRLRAS
jgi:uracil-DNA glycosylase